MNKITAAAQAQQSSKRAPSYVDPKEYAAKCRSIKQHATAQKARGHTVLTSVAVVIGTATAYDLAVLIYTAIHRHGMTPSFVLPVFVVLCAMLVVAAGLAQRSRRAYRFSVPLLVFVAIAGLVGQYVAQTTLSKSAGWLTLLVACFALYLLSDAAVKRLFS